MAKGRSGSKTEQKEQDARKKLALGRDIPLASTPVVPFSKAEQRERAYGRDMDKYGYVTDDTVKKFKSNGK